MSAETADDTQNLGGGSTQHRPAPVDYSAHQGMELTGKVTTVLNRGKTIIENGKYRGAAGDGRYIAQNQSAF